MQDELKTRKQVAALFSVNPLTIRAWERKGLISPKCHVNGRPRYRLADLHHLLTDKIQP
jgi:DNA-binding transcriptional MerR regulator